MPRCPMCHVELAPNVRFCPKDGTTLREDSVQVSVATALAVEIPRDTVPVKTQPRKKRPEAPADPLIGRVLDGRYRVRGLLGAGGVGAVYEGEHVEIKKTVALKVLHAMFGSTDEFRRRFEREARALSQLQHPTCVQVLDFGRVEKVERIAEDGRRVVDSELGPKLAGMSYLVMEYVRGTLLADRLFDGPPLSPREAALITRDLLAALRHAHALGIVHRDIKPANVILTGPLTLDGDAGPRVKLLDFGLAKQLGPEGDAQDPLTQAGMVFGTPGYLSPEQAAGLPADERADLYSLGVLLFEMACGRRPFAKEEPLDVVRDHIQTPPPRPRGLNPEISSELERVILKALEKDPARRFASAEAFAVALAECPEAGAGAPGGGLKLPAWLMRRLPTHAPAWLEKLPKVRLLGRELPPLATLGGALGLLLLFVLTFALTRGKPAPAKAPAAHPAPPPIAAPAAIPAIAQHHLDLAVGYQRKLWCSDAIEELDRALAAAPALRHNPDVSKTAIACLSPKTYDKASRFLVEELGQDARAPLTLAAAQDPSAEVRRAAALVLSRLPQ